MLTEKLSSKDLIVLKNVLAAFLVKGFSLFLSLFMMPAYMAYFDDQSTLGVWYTILSVLTWILNFDLGIGNGLRNKLSEAIAKSDQQAVKEYISSAYWMVGWIILIIGALGAPIIRVLNWNDIFNIGTDAIGAVALADAMTYTFIGIAAQFLFRLISSVIYALQKSSLNNLLSLATSILLLCFLKIAPNGDAEYNLKMFAIAYGICANMPLILASLFIFSRILRNARPQYKYIRKEKAYSVMTLGGVFFACQILYMLIANTNEMLITHYTGPGDVVEYQIYNKLFSLGSTVFMLALTPVWSAVSKAVAEKDFVWLKSIYKKLKMISWIGIFGEFVLILFLQYIVNLWLGSEAISVNYLFATVFALFGGVMLYQSAISTIVNGMGKMKIQAICYGVGIIGKFVAVHIGVTLTGSWIVVVLVNALILIPYCVVQTVSLNRMMQNI